MLTSLAVKFDKLDDNNVAGQKWRASVLHISALSSVHYGDTVTSIGGKVELLNSHSAATLRKHSCTEEKGGYLRGLKRFPAKS